MRTFTAGIFEVRVSDPSPMWVEVRSIENLAAPPFRFHPENLPDLRHVIERAIAEVERRDSARAR